MRVLIVDDEEEAVDVLSDFLSDLGYSVRVALNGVEALDILERNVIDVILLDLRMPRIDGEGILKVVRDQYPHIDVIIMTGYSDGGSTKERIMSYNVEYYLEKPIDLDQIQKIVTSVKRKRSL